VEKTKYGKYFITEYVESGQKSPWARTLKPTEETHLLRIDAEIIKGLACFARCNWFWPSMMQNKPEVRSTKPHSHTYDEIIGLVGTNFDNAHDLGGEVEINMGGEKHIVTQSTLIYIPAGLEHGPFRELRIDRPIFQFEFGLNGVHD
jgi:hypothetical protein